MTSFAAAVIELNLPTSALGSPVGSEQNNDLASNSRFHRPAIVEEQQVLHLVSCSWEEFLLLEQPFSRYYDYVDGLATHQLDIGDAGQCTIGTFHATSLECSDRTLYIYMIPFVQVLSEKLSEWTTSGDRSSDSRNRGSSSTSTQPARQSYGLRHPDFSITKARRNSDSSVSSGEDAIIKRKVKFYLPYKPDLLALVEITSVSTRDVDLDTKWTVNTRSGISWCNITFASCSSTAQTWHKKVHKPDDSVDFPYYCTLNKTAKELVDERLMSRHVRKVFNDERSKKAFRNEKERRKEKHVAPTNVSYDK